MLLKELECLLLHLLRVVFVLFLEFRHRALDGSHSLLRAASLRREWPEEEFDADRHDHDGPAPTRDDGVDQIHECE